jgi:hypothetical protein
MSRTPGVEDGRIKHESFPSRAHMEPEAQGLCSAHQGRCAQHDATGGGHAELLAAGPPRTQLPRDRIEHAGGEVISML